MVQKLSAVRVNAVRAVAANSNRASIVTLTYQQTIFLLRVSLAIIFFWFGFLKLIDASPAVELIRQSFPLFANSPYLELLGLGEILIAAGLLLERLSKYAAALMVFHLIGTLCIVIVSPATIFAPAFPILTMNGEFVAKNLVLIVAGIAVVSAKRSSEYKL
ncbi:MAG TPA: DUF417 family protein [Blastocatellia bacterium]|nr:DUF417 family protein [Blastocatellia bacterium]